MTTTQKKPGFGGQWVEVLNVGTHSDNTGAKHNIDTAFLDAVASNFNVELHEPPAVIGHPETNAPAYGWICGLRRNGEALEAQFCDNDPQFEEMVASGRFKKRSAALYLDKATAPGGKAPTLMHVGFLGAKPPAVKGLKNIELNEAQATVFEINFSEGEFMTQDKKDKTLRQEVADFFRETFGQKESAAVFTEADVRKLVQDSVTAVKTEFSETVKQRDTKIAELETKLGQQAGSSQRAGLVSFCDSLGVEKVIPAFKTMGVIEFMEALASMSDKKVAVIAFAEEGGKQVEKKNEITPLEWFKNFLSAMPAYIKFGEQFGGLKLKGNGEEVVDAESLTSMRGELGLNKEKSK